MTRGIEIVLSVILLGLVLVAGATGGFVSAVLVAVSFGVGILFPKALDGENI